jgi:1,4-dihydroxy-2-naphthoyl-CoA hydrolase
VPFPTAEQINAHMFGFDKLYGLEVVSCSEEEARGTLVLRDEVRQPAGLLHGGVYASMAEALASVATALTVFEEGKTAVGQSNSTNFMRPISAGSVHALARRMHRGRSTWVWDVEFRDDEGRLCAVTRMTVAVRPAAR